MEIEKGERLNKEGCIKNPKPWWGMVDAFLMIWQEGAYS